jgi:hypothetical protein
MGFLSLGGSKKVWVMENDRDMGFLTISPAHKKYGWKKAWVM